MTAKKRIRVFVVDDERIIALTLATILNKSGFIATAFFGPLEALTATRSSVPDLLISDVVMPEYPASTSQSSCARSAPGARYCCFQGRPLQQIC